MGMLAAVSTLTSCIVSVAMYFVLRNRIENYCVTWVCFSCLALGMVAFTMIRVPETLPSQIRKSLSTPMLNPIATQGVALRIVIQDPVLVLFSGITFLFWVYFLGFHTTKV